MIKRITSQSFSTRAMITLLFLLFTTTLSWADVKISGIAPKYYVDENTANGTVIAQFTVIDKTITDGAYETLSYTMTSDYLTDVINDLFEVNEVNNFSGVRTVEISVKNQEKLDFESVKLDRIKLCVANNSNDDATAYLDIVIKDLNEDFTLSDQAFTLSEKKPDASNWEAGTKVGDVMITDPDYGAFGHHTCNLTNSGIPFDFIPGTSTLIVTDGSVLDYETKPTWKFMIKVSDGENNHDATITVKLTDVNEAPMIENHPNTYTIIENAANGTVLGKFDIFDLDNTDKEYEQLTYKLEGTVSDLFEVQEKANREKRTVSIVVKDNSNIDYEKYYKEQEENATYPVTFTATDTNGNEASETFNIVIEDVNESLTATGGTFYLNEHSPIGSCVSKNTYTNDDEKTLGKVESEDEDSYNAGFRKITYKMSDNNTGDDDSKFNIDPRSGLITSAAEFDYETDSKENHTYTFLVTVSDGEFSKDVEVKVEIQNIEEPTISWGEADVYVEENTKVDEVIANINDILESRKETIVGDVSFEIDQDASGDANGLFEIDYNGSITVQKSLDFETLYPDNTFTVRVVATDSEDNKHNIDIKIVVTDVNETPSVSDLTISIPETKTSADGSIGKVAATDPDKNPTLGFNKLHYMIEGVDSNIEFPFEINENTGDITVRQGETLNYVKHDEYKFKVKVTDCPIETQLSIIANVTIKITDVNIPSKFITLNDVYEVEENADSGTEVNGDQILVYDDDAADVCTSSKSSLTITITDNNATPARDAAKLFEIVRDGNTNDKHITPFVIKTKAGIDYESLYDKNSKDAIFDVTLTIKDSEERTKYPQKNCKIRVIDINEEPFENKKSCSFSVDENTTASTTLGKVEVHDPDMYKAEYGTLYYSLIDKDAAQFAIDAEGNLSTIYGAKYDYETKDKYEFRVEVTDKNYRITVPVTVTINNMYETPAFAEGTQVLQVDESAEKGTKVGTITAKSDAAPKYSFVTDLDFDDYKYFDIDESTGVITVKDESLADFNTKHEYHVMVKATDGENTDYYNRKEFAIKVRLKMENLFSADNAFTSYVSPENMTVPEGLSAYVITNIDGSSVTISQIDYLPQSVPVLLQRAYKDVNLFKTVTGNGTSFNVNKLMINETDREVSVGELYLLYRDELVLCSSGVLPAGSVYLPITDGAAKTRSLSIGDGENTTSIEDVKCQITNDEWYDLQGRRLGSKPTKKGIYISNGSKVVIK